MPFATKELNEILFSSNVLNKLIHKLLISLSKRLLKTRQQTHPIKPKRKTTDPQKPLENKDISGNINPSPALINTYSQPVDKSVNKPVQTEENYRLTEDNWSTIDPMIGLSEDDIAAFFNNN